MTACYASAFERDLQPHDSYAVYFNLWNHKGRACGCTQPPLLYHMRLENDPQVGHTFHLWLIPFKEKNMTDAPYWTVLPP